MYIKNILPLLALASAAPLLDPRALVIQTVTEEVVVTITDYTTVFVTPGSQSTDSVSNGDATMTVSADTTAASPQSSVVTITSSADVTSTTSATSTLTTNHPPPPPLTTSTSSTTTTSPMVTPTTTTKSVVVSPSTTSTTTAASKPTSPAGGGGIYPVETLEGASAPDGPCTADSPCEGDITYYGIGMGACGPRQWYETGNTVEDTMSPWTDADDVVAISMQIFGSFSNAGTPDSVNTLCKRFVKIHAGPGGVSVIARVVDRCVGCAKYDLDLSEQLFKKIAPAGDGRVSGIRWEWV